MTDQKRLTVDVPEEIHRLAKVEAAKTGRTIKEVLNELIEKWLNGEIKLEENKKGA